MPDLKTLQESMIKSSLEANNVVNDATIPVSEKRERLDKIEADIKAFSDQIADEKYLVDARKKFAVDMGMSADALESNTPAHSEPNNNLTAAQVKSLGQLITEAPNFQAIIKGGNVGGHQFSTGGIELKATLTSTAAGGLTGSGLAQPQVLPGILSLLFQPLTVADLMPSGTASGALIRYLRETVATNAAATVAEGAAKPESTLNFAAVDEPVRKIATWLKVTDEMFEDVAQLRSYIDARLGLFVRIHEEAQLLTGSGVAPQITGFLNRAGLTAAQALGADTAPDAIYKEITKIRVASFLEPTGIVINPTNWQTVRLAKDANNQYYGGGPFTAAYGNGGPAMAPDMLWGKTVVATTAMTLGTALIGAFATAAQVWRRGGLTVEATNSNEDDFKNNLVMIRAEERLALAVYRPAAFGTVTGLL